MPSETRTKRRKAPRKKANRGPLTFLIVAASLAVLCSLFLVDGNVVVRFFLAVLALALSGSAIASVNGIKSSYGAYLLGGRSGISFVDSLADRNRRLWTGLADWGFSFSFGLLSLLMFRKHMGKKAFLAGIVSVVLIMAFVFPYLSVVLSFIDIPQLSTAAGASATAIASSTQGYTPAYYILMVLSVIGGFSLFTMVLIIYAGAEILFGIIEFLVGYASSNPNYSILSSQIPGVAPIIPGITIPFFAGIISLVILLVVHEFSHGIQARLAKVRIKSIGVILFGIIPMGAFVEPDESRISRLNPREQDRISISGISANMAVSMVFFAIVIAMLYLAFPGISTGGVLVTSVISNSPAYGVIAPNATILMWNGQQIRNEYDLANAESAYSPGGYVNITTSAGSYTIKPGSGGKLGVYIAPAETPFAYQVANFIYAVAALSFGLNFFVAIFNLMPIPGFDGWRIYQSKVKDKRLLNALAVLIIAAILVNALPWLWTL
jgi:membrane-associated protease RseP (regulator of RpoE activity)